MILRQLTQELLEAIGIEAEGGNRRRATSHVRQIAMYVCHTAFALSMEEVAAAFGRERSTVGHACRMVEHRREDPGYDAFVATVERMASAVHLLVPRTAA
ncbi:helix-turn-helix domain-containing protein [Rhizobium sp. G187]